MTTVWLANNTSGRRVYHTSNHQGDFVQKEVDLPTLEALGLTLCSFCSQRAKSSEIFSILGSQEDAWRAMCGLLVAHGYHVRVVTPSTSGKSMRTCWTTEQDET